MSSGGWGGGDTTAKSGIGGILIKTTSETFTTRFGTGGGGCPGGNGPSVNGGGGLGGGGEYTGGGDFAFGARGGGGGEGGGGVPVSLSVDRGVRGGQTRRPVGSGQRTAMHVVSAWTCDCLWTRDCLAACDSDCASGRAR